MSKSERRWPWNNFDDEDNYIEPYDEYEDIKSKGENEWGNM